MKNNLVNFLQGNEDHIWLFNKLRQQSSIDDDRIICLLGRYVPKAFVLSKDKHGKPLIISSGPPLYISIAHSGSFLGLALSAKQEIGLDMETVIERSQRKKISTRYFLDSEPKSCLLDFYRSWTAREAYIKIIGGRLFKRLGQIELSFKEHRCLIGLDGLTHQVIFHQYQDYMLALCRAQNTRALISCANTETLAIFGDSTTC